MKCVLKNEEKDFELFENKMIILYILENSKKPLTLDQIVKYCEEFEDITYFDICTYIETLISNGFVEKTTQEENVFYNITTSGIYSLQELLEFIPGVNLYNIKKMINKNIIEIKTDSSINTTIIPIKNDEYKVSCYIKDGNDELVNITLYAGNKEQAKNISKNWSQNAEVIYEKLLEMLTKN